MEWPCTSIPDSSCRHMSASIHLYTRKCHSWLQVKNNSGKQSSLWCSALVIQICGSLVIYCTCALSLTVHGEESKNQSKSLGSLYQNTPLSEWTPEWMKKETGADPMSLCWSLFPPLFNYKAASTSSFTSSWHILINLPLDDSKTLTIHRRYKSAF